MDLAPVVNRRGEGLRALIRGKELVKHFKQAAWSSQEEIDAFARHVGPVEPSDVERLLAVITDRGLRDSPAHRMRCAAFEAIVNQSLSEALFLPMVRALDKCDRVALPVLVTVLPKVNNVGAHAELCKVLASSDADVRSAAGKVMKQVGGKTCFEVLTTLIGHPDFHGRIEALDAMVPKAGYHAVPLLATVVARGEPRERAFALRYLGNKQLMAKALGAAKEAIAVAFDDKDERVVTQAIVSYADLAPEEEFLARLGERLDSRAPLIAKAVIDGLQRYDSPRVISILAGKIRKGPNVVRLAAIEAFEKIGGDRVIPPLVEALSHRQIVVRTRAAEVLSSLAVNKRVDLARTILWLMRSRDVNIRRMAVEIARKVGDPSGELAPKILRYLRDEDWWVRERVMDALVEMSGLALVRHLVDYLQDPSDVVRRYAIGALMRIKDPRTVGALVRVAMDDADWWVREEAVRAIGGLGDPRAVPYVIDLMSKSKDLRLVCVEAVHKLGARDAAPHVANLMAEADAPLRMAIVRCLDALDDRAQAFALAAFRDDEDLAVRSAVLELLTRWEMVEEAKELGAERYASLLDRMLLAVERSAGDDLLLAPSQVPYMKRLGAMTPLSKTPFSADQVRALLLPLLTPAQVELLDALRDVDFSYEVKSTKLRFRAHVFGQLAGLSAVFRIVKNDVPHIDKLGLPDVVRGFGKLKNGLVLIGGPTGSGKSTTLAALIDFINRTESRHIISLEDPIEVVHDPKSSLVNQREVGSHTRSFANALRFTLRQDPDVILVGEMRDYATIAFAVTAAETGHLVFGTVHTASADTAVDRLINAFPPAQQLQVRAMLAQSLRAVACQHLLRRKGGPGRVLAVEVMLNNDAISNLIRKGKTFQIPSTIATSRDAGMQLMDQELARLVREGVVHQEEAFMKASDKKAFESLLNEERKLQAADQRQAVG